MFHATVSELLKFADPVVINFKNNAEHIKYILDNVIFTILIFNRFSFLLVSAQFPPQPCTVPCAPGRYCSFGQCIPFSAEGGPVVGGIIPLGASGVIPPGAGQFGAPCPRKFRLVNNMCVLTGSASHSFKITQIISIMLIGIFL